MWLGHRLALAMTLAIALAACSPSQTTPAEVSPDPASATLTQGRFVLDFTIDRSTVRPRDPVTGEAMLSVLGPVGATISGSSTLLGFEFFEVGGPMRHVVPVFDTVCAPHRLTPNTPLTSPILVSGAVPEGDPNIDWYRQFLAAKVVNLPLGEWDVSVTASFFDAQECTGVMFDLRATVRVRVIE